MRQIGLVDTTLRDGQLSLWACRMRAADMAPAIHDLDVAGYDAIEFEVPTARFPRAVKDLHEDPWAWLKLGTARAGQTELRMHGQVRSISTPIPEAIRDMFLDRLVALGISTTRLSDPWNDFSALRPVTDQLRARGFKSIVNIIYSVSPRHDISYFAAKAREAAHLNPHRICFKDVGGLLTPEVADGLLPAIVNGVGDIPLEFHAHCSNGFGEYVTLQAASAGINVLHTAVPPLAGAASLPSVFSLTENLRARGFDVPIDLEHIQRVASHLGRVARIRGLPLGGHGQYVESRYEHQVPGGMISNLQFQLEQLGMSERLDATLAETAQVRADLGYPIMVTPLAQFVGSQAAINVMTGERYRSVTDEIIEYALGMWGQEAVEVMDGKVRDLILNRPRTSEVQRRASIRTSVDETLAEVRERLGNEVADEELITRVLSGVQGGSLDLSETPDLTDNHHYLSHDGSAGVKLLRLAAADASIRRFEYADGDYRAAFTR